MPRKLASNRFTPEWWETWTEREPNTGRHLWLGAACQLGYGRVYMGGEERVLIHRIAYEKAFGPFDPSLKVCHRCDTPSCVNPDHLFLGTQQENLRDMFRKRRGRPRGRPHGWRDKTPLATTLAVRELASEISDASVIGNDVLHLMRTDAVLSGWRHVTGAPPIPPGHDGPSCQWPQNETDNPTSAKVRLASAPSAVATVAPCCGGAR